MKYPLADLDGEIRSLKSQQGSIPVLWFCCPTCDTGHFHMIPHHVGPPTKDLFVKHVWSRTDGGSEVEGITLAPSYSTKCLHCFVRGGVVEVL